MIQVRFTQYKVLDDYRVKAEKHGYVSIIKRAVRGDSFEKAYAPGPLMQGFMTTVIGMALTQEAATNPARNNGK